MRIFIIHGWGGSPESNWLPWLKSQLESKGHEVHVPEMPNTDEPEIEAWVSKLSEEVGTPDENTYFVGHSIGCQTILRYLQTVEAKVGGVLFVAGWINLNPEPIAEEGGTEIAKPWLETLIEWDKIKTKVVAIFSDDDPFVPVEDAQIFEEKLSAKIIIKEKKGHFDDVEQPEVLKELLDML